METIENSDIRPISIQNEMKDCYIDYAMSVIVGRALPDVRDGLKPVHRRILYAMHEQGFRSDRPYRKSARIVGEVLGKYHPHGDQAVYQTMVRMVQSFSMRETLIDGHGNFGSVDGDSAAAARYTEARMSKISESLLRDIEKDTVEWQPNFDDSLKEPVVLPAKYPNLLVNGSAGIAVGMATNIPPHNLSEVISGTIALIDNPEISDLDLMRLIPGPDFPTGAQILGKSGIYNAFKTGRGAVTMRSVVDIEEYKNSHRLIITELPYQVNKANLIIAIANLVKDKKIDGIRDIRDESDRKGMRAIIELKRDADPKVVLNTLYKKTQLQCNFGVINLVLVKNRPVLLSTREVLTHYINHSREVIRRRTAFDLKKAEEKAHILEGLKIALDNIDDVIALIRSAKDTTTARDELMVRFKLSERQAKAILEMRLQALTGLEREKVENELRELGLKIADLKDILANAFRVDEIISGELSEVKAKFGSERRTVILDEEVGGIENIDLIPDEPCVITVSSRGYVKRTRVDEFRAMSRGRQGVTGASLKEDDATVDCFATNTHAHLLIFTTKGRVFKLRAFEIPECSRNSVGKYMINLCDFQPDESYNTILAIQDFDSHDKNCLAFCTRKGTVKRTLISQFENVNRNGKIAIGLNEGDELINVRESDEDSKIFLSSASGMCITFPSNEVRPTGRTSMGVRGLKFKKLNDAVVSMEVVHPDEMASDINLLSVTENGYGKKTGATQYTVQHRGGSGLIDIITDDRNGSVISTKKVHDGDEMLLVSEKGKIIRTYTDQVRAIGRRTKGVKLFNLKDGDRLTGFAVIGSDLLEDTTGDGDSPEGSQNGESQATNSEGDERPAVDSPVIDPPEKPEE